MQRPGAKGVAFSAYSADTEDYFAILPSDESLSDVEEAPAAVNSDSVEELASAFTSSSCISSNVFTPIGSLNGSRSVEKTRRKKIHSLGPGVFDIGGGEELKVSPRSLQQHNVRRTQLQEALDATKDAKKSAQLGRGDAPFRFVRQRKRNVNFEDEIDLSGASPAPVGERMEGHAPEKKNVGRRHSSGMSDDNEDETVKPDPLYDEQLDNADEQWVETNLRGVKPETDASLCCPCCFVTVCMVCERHVTYINQYRATVAINCRVKKDEILTYSSENSRMSASLPFHKRQNLGATGNSVAMSTSGQLIARLLQDDEFFPVACSDCGTMVGVYDRNQQYHFFNALPSNC